MQTLNETKNYLLLLIGVEKSSDLLNRKKTFYVLYVCRSRLNLVYCEMFQSSKG